MPALMPSEPTPNFSIAAVERETGLGKDTLRVWEKRYGFPQPGRDAAGDRRYPAEQVARLRSIRRLLDAGWRPSKAVGLSAAELDAALSALKPTESVVLSKTADGLLLSEQMIAGFLATIGQHDPQGLRHSLSQALSRMGLERFVIDLMAPLTVAVGQAWEQGRFRIFEEHLFTQVIGGVMRNAISVLAPAPGGQRPKVLLTTLPGELHGLGLLMVEAILTLEGCSCVCLGTQTPVNDVAMAAQAHRADIVGMSFSNVLAGADVLAQVQALRQQLPASTALWVGGACPVLYQQAGPGIQTVPRIDQVSRLLAQWRQAH